MNIIELTPSVFIFQDDNYYLVTNCCVVLDSELILNGRKWIFIASEKLSVEQVLSHENCPTYFEEDPENWTINGIEAYYSRMIE